MWTIYISENILSCIFLLMDHIGLQYTKERSISIRDSNTSWKTIFHEQFHWQIYTYHCYFDFLLQPRMKSCKSVVNAAMLNIAITLTSWVIKKCCIISPTSSGIILNISQNSVVFTAVRTTPTLFQRRVNTQQKGIRSEKMKANGNWKKKIQLVSMYTNRNSCL